MSKLGTTFNSVPDLLQLQYHLNSTPRKFSERPLLYGSEKSGTFLE